MIAKKLIPQTYIFTNPIHLFAIMKSIAPQYTPYKKRILGGLAGVFIFSLFFTFLVFITDINKYRIAAFI